MLGLTRARLIYPYARLRFGVLSELARLRALGKPTVVHHEAPYDGRGIVLLALYEKGELRPDVIRLLRAVREAGTTSWPSTR